MHVKYVHIECEALSWTSNRRSHIFKHLGLYKQTNKRKTDEKEESTNYYGVRNALMVCFDCTTALTTNVVVRIHRQRPMSTHTYAAHTPKQTILHMNIWWNKNKHLSISKTASTYTRSMRCSCIRNRIHWKRGGWTETTNGHIFQSHQMVVSVVSTVRHRTVDVLHLYWCFCCHLRHFYRRRCFFSVCSFLFVRSICSTVSVSWSTRHIIRVVWFKSKARTLNKKWTAKRN